MYSAVLLFVLFISVTSVWFGPRECGAWRLVLEK
jgi:hypothetical protein